MGVVPALTHTRRSEVRHERAPRYRQARSAHRRSVPFRPRLRLKQSSNHCQRRIKSQIPIVYEIGYVNLFVGTAKKAQAEIAKAGSPALRLAFLWILRRVL